VGPDRWGTAWHFWFLEAVVYIVLGVTALLTIPLVDRVERRFPFAVAGALLTVGLLFRYEVLTGPDGPRLGLPHMVFWFFMLGWAAAKARTVWHRAAVTAVAVLSIPGFFDNPSRDTVVLAGVCLLVWIGSIPLPAVLARLAGVLAGASLSVYVTHWVVYPLVKPTSELLAVLVSFAVGIAWWRLTTWAMGRSLALLRR
jgi:surface polysaccharide O-acyltransferase-like enzyme